MTATKFNDIAAMKLRECARLLRQQGANPFRIGAYERAAQTLDELDVDAAAILDRRGIEGLIELPAIGSGIGAALEELARTGRLPLLDRLHGESPPEALFQTIPGIGPLLAHRIHDALQIDTLEALEAAAHDGSLAEVPGIGQRRLDGIRAALAQSLRRNRPRRMRPRSGPSVADLLSVDAEYRRKAAAGHLEKIAPRRFNPQGDAWLPILHTTRDRWHITALFSNTARAHQLGRTDDWVVIFYYDEEHHEDQCTVVTETRGSLTGERVVRGREDECLAHYGDVSQAVSGLA